MTRRVGFAMGVIGCLSAAACGARVSDEVAVAGTDAGTELGSGSGSSSGSGNSGGDAAVADASDPWGCLDQPSEATSNSPVAVTFTAFSPLQVVVSGGSQGGSDLDLTSYTPVTGVAIQACNMLDPQCAAPLTPAGMSDGEGQATLTVQGNFSGFFELTGSGEVASQLYAGRLVADASTLALPVPVFTTSALSLLEEGLGTEINPGAGLKYFSRPMTASTGTPRASHSQPTRRVRKAPCRGTRRPQRDIPRPLPSKRRRPHKVPAESRTPRRAW